MGKIVYDMIPESFVQLNLELRNHPDIMNELSHFETANSTFEDRIGTIAACCGILLDGYYVQKDLEILADKMTTILKNRRALIISTAAQ